MSDFVSVTYHKGSHTVIATTPTDVVRLEFEGYVAGNPVFTGNIRTALDVPLGMQPVIPLYAYPSFAGSDWDTLIANPAGIVIANPDSGPGVSQNFDFNYKMNQARTAGVKVIGYVTLDIGGGAGTRTQSAVIADINTWYSLYTIDGIFFDLAPTGANGDRTAYFRQVCDHVHSKDRAQIVVANPGTYPLTADYVTPADIVCVYEGEYLGNSYATFQIPSYAHGWVPTFPPTKFLHLVYGISSPAVMRSAMEHAGELGVHWFYGAQTNSVWLALATYWDAEVDHLSKVSVDLDVLDRRNHHGPVRASDVMTDVVYLHNATDVPSVNPTGGGVLYVQSGSLKYRGSSGTVTTLGNA